MRTDREIEIIDTPDERPRPKKPKKKKSTNRLILNTTIAFTVLFMGMPVLMAVIENISSIAG